MAGKITTAIMVMVVWAVILTTNVILMIMAQAAIAVFSGASAIRNQATWVSRAMAIMEATRVANIAGILTEKEEWIYRKIMRTMEAVSMHRVILIMEETVIGVMTRSAMEKMTGKEKSTGMKTSMVAIPGITEMQARVDMTVVGGTAPGMKSLHGLGMKMPNAGAGWIKGNLKELALKDINVQMNASAKT